MDKYVDYGTKPLIVSTAVKRGGRQWSVSYDHYALIMLYTAELGNDRVCISILTGDPSHHFLGLLWQTIFSKMAALVSPCPPLPTSCLSAL